MLIFYSDPHIGVTRRANTSAESRRRLKDRVMESCRQVSKIKSEDDIVFCLGDLFDRHTNSEEDILLGLSVFEFTDVVIGGNHDVINNTSSKCSLDVVKEAVRDDERYVVMAETGETVSEEFIVDEGEAGTVCVVAVPHHSSQGLFDKAMSDASEISDARQAAASILILHCNYGQPKDTIRNDETLNLSEKKAIKLLDSFDYILIGHEHNSKELLNGRVRILGNTMPTSFSDIGDKYITTFTLSDGFTKIKIWDKNRGYVKVNIDDHEKLSSIGGEVEFVDIVGSRPISEAKEVSSTIEELFKGNESLIAARNGVNFISNSTALPINDEVVRPLDAVERIRDLVVGTDLEGLWDDVIESVKGEFCD